MSWDSPTVTGEVVTENARLLSWQEIREIVETILLTIYEPRTEFEDAGRRIGVTIDDIQLSLLRVRENNAQGRSGLYVPAWVFYGEEYMDDFPSVVGVDKHIVPRDQRRRRQASSIWPKAIDMILREGASRFSQRRSKAALLRRFFFGARAAAPPSREGTPPSCAAGDGKNFL